MRVKPGVCKENNMSSHFVPQPTLVLLRVAKAPKHYENQSRKVPTELSGFFGIKKKKKKHVPAAVAINLSSHTLTHENVFCKLQSC